MNYSYVELMHFANEQWIYILPLVLIGVDIATGWATAWKDGSFKSSKMRTGLTKKVGEIILIGLAEVFSIAMGLPAAVVQFFSIYVVLTELLSCIENLDKMGTPMPAWLRDKVNNELSEINEKAPEIGNKK